MKPDPRPTCQACGAVIPADSEFCPVCALRGALNERHETVELNVEPNHSPSASRFDHYQVLTGENRTLLELGSGATGVTYKAIDKPSIRSGPKKISVARLPVTGNDLFGSEEEISFLDRAWANQDVNIVTIVTWAGVGKSTLVNHRPRWMAAKCYRSAELVGIKW